MLLAIDAGNTNIVFALYDDKGQKAASWRIRTQNGRTADEYAAWLYPLFMAAKLSFSDIGATIISSVIPDENRALRELCEKVFGVDGVIIGSDITDLGIDILLPKPEEIGADRLTNVVAINHIYRAPAIVVDFGTATNFDVVNADGAYCGGAIAPGVNLSMQALYKAAAKLPKISIRKPEKAIGNDTVTAMQSGLYFGYISMIEGMIKRLADELDGDPLVLATGGLATLFADGTPLIETVDEDLTLKGLLHIHNTRMKA